MKVLRLFFNNENVQGVFTLEVCTVVGPDHERQLCGLASLCVVLPTPTGVIESYEY